MQCKKCTSLGTILLRKKDSYCDDCFSTSINHKFRACIGRNKILSKNEKVLVCLSGALGSTVLLELIHNGISMDNHKKLRIVPIFLHITAPEDITLAERVINQCKKYNYDVHLMYMSQYMEESLKIPEINRIPSLDKPLQDEFDSLMKSLSSTTINDYFPKLRRNLIIKCAEMFKCNFVFTGETTTTLAIHLLSNLALGRGSQAEHDVGFCDARNGKIKILRPIKEISLEELHYYANIKQLDPIQNNEMKANSLQSVIGGFVHDLQDNFPATISTVCKTADKIGIHDDTKRENQCVFCESDLGRIHLGLTAMEATKFSRTVSYRSPKADENNSSDIVSLQDDELDVNALFPLIHKTLCYGCSRNYSEIDNHKMPNHIQVSLGNHLKFFE